MLCAARGNCSNCPCSASRRTDRWRRKSRSTSNVLPNSSFRGTSSSVWLPLRRMKPRLDRNGCRQPARDCARLGARLHHTRDAFFMPYDASVNGARRRASIPVDVGGVVIGGNAPIVVQSMTNTDTADIEGTARQCADLARAGSEIVRITVDRDEAAKAVPHIRDRLAQMGVTVPLVGDFHYNGHTLLADHPACA